MYWVRELKDGKLTGNMTGHPNREQAEKRRGDLEWSSRHDPSWRQWAGYSWEIVKGN